MSLLKTAWSVVKQWWRYRSSQTGRFVTKKYAEKHPDVTERERAKR